MAIAPPKIEINFKPTQENIKKNIQDLKDDLKKQLDDLTESLKKAKDRVEKKAKEMKDNIEKHKQEFEDYKKEWSEHDTKWKAAHTPEMERKTMVFVKDIENMETELQKFVTKRMESITKYGEKTKVSISQSAQKSIDDATAELDSVQKQLQDYLTETLNSLLPPLPKLV
jgi:DNA repair exonuclease SbcCD ATPase subunit